MNKPKWKDAPEWANVLIVANINSSHYAWAEAYEINSQFATVCNLEYVIPNDKMLDCWTLVETRPTTNLTRKEIIAKSKSFGVQEGGKHYTDMELQPLEATYLRYGLEGLKAAIHTKIDKYISRKKDDELGQLKKAAHCMNILLEIAELEAQQLT